MSIKNRIERLEKNRAETIDENEICDHSSFSFSVACAPESDLYKPDSKYTENFRCGNCMFYDYVFTRYDLDENETLFLYFLHDTYKRENMRLKSNLIVLLSELGLIEVAEFRATEAQKKNSPLPVLISSRSKLDRFHLLDDATTVAIENQISTGASSLENKIEYELRAQSKNTTLIELTEQWEFLGENRNSNSIPARLY